MISSVKAMIFFSTPHQGGRHANTLDNVMGAFGYSKEYVKQLSPQSGYLQKLNDEFRKYCEKLELYSFYETLGTSLAKVTVSLIFIPPKKRLCDGLLF
jgi:cell shape-determining protein MreC